MGGEHFFARLYGTGGISQTVAPFGLSGETAGSWRNDQEPRSLCWQTFGAAADALALNRDRLKPTNIEPRNTGLEDDGDRLGTVWSISQVATTPSHLSRWACTRTVFMLSSDGVAQVDDAADPVEVAGTLGQAIDVLNGHDRELAEILGRGINFSEEIVAPSKDISSVQTALTILNHHRQTARPAP